MLFGLILLAASALIPIIIFVMAVARASAGNYAEREAAALAARKAAEKARIQAERETIQAAKRAEKIETARRLAEYRERELFAARELRALQQATAAPVQPSAAPADPEPVADPVQAAPAPFSGQVVAFTGKLRSMSRSQAIDKVRAAGGKAYKTMPAGTTLLVVGDNPGMKKLDKADEWLGQLHKITEAQFLAMFAA